VGLLACAGVVIEHDGSDFGCDREHVWGGTMPVTYRRELSRQDPADVVWIVRPVVIGDNPSPTQWPNV